MDKVLSMRVVKKEVSNHRGGGGEGSFADILPTLNVPPRSPQLPSGQLIELEEFFVKYKN